MHSVGAFGGGQGWSRALWLHCTVRVLPPFYHSHHSRIHLIFRPLTNIIVTNHQVTSYLYMHIYHSLIIQASQRELYYISNYSCRSQVYVWIISLYYDETWFQTDYLKRGFIIVVARGCMMKYHTRPAEGSILPGPELARRGSDRGTGCRRRAAPTTCRSEALACTLLRKETCIKYLN